VVVLVVAGGFVSVQSLVGPVPPALVLPHMRPTPAGAGSSSIDGTWTVAIGSSAGYRVPEEFLWQHGTLVARTTAVTGKFVIAHAEVSSATLRVDLSKVTAGGKTPSGLAGILDTASHRGAVFTLTKPIVIGSAPAINATFTASATGLLAMHGTTHLVTFAVAARYAGSQLEAAGSIPIVLSDWDIRLDLDFADASGVDVRGANGATDRDLRDPVYRPDRAGAGVAVDRYAAAGFLIDSRKWDTLRIVSATSDVEQLLRGAALRVTRPRVAVLTAVYEHPHADTDSLIGVVREDLGEVSHQAVYDVLRALTAAGLVRRIQPSGSVARYESRVGDNHHHVVCRSCGFLADVDCAVGTTPCLTATNDHGFAIDEAEVVYWGLCLDCSTAPDS